MPPLMILQYAIKFIATDTDYRKFLLIDKISNKELRRQVLKQALLYETDFARLGRRRIHIWRHLL